MGTLSSVVSALSTFYQDSNDPHDPEQVQLSILRLMAKLPTIAAYAYKKSIGQPFLYPDNSLDLIENFLTMMFAVPSERYEVSHNTVVTPQAAADPARRPRAELLHVAPCASSARARPTSSRRSRPASTRCGARCTAAPTRPSSRCSSASPPTAATSTSTCAWPRTPTTRSGSRASVTASTRTTTPVPASSRTPADRVIAELGTTDEQLDLALRARGGRAQRRVLRRAQALPERRLLLRPHLPGDGLPHADVPGAVRDGPAARVDRALGGDDGEPGDQDRPPAPDLHRRDQASRTSRSTSAADRRGASRRRAWSCSPPSRRSAFVDASFERGLRIGAVEEHAVLGVAHRVAHPGVVARSPTPTVAALVGPLSELVVGDLVGGVLRPVLLHLGAARPTTCGSGGSRCRSPTWSCSRASRGTSGTSTPPPASPAPTCSPCRARRR